jgi:hypothetical protein
VNKTSIQLRVAGEPFWAYRYPDLPYNQAEINTQLSTEGNRRKHSLTDAYAYGDRVEFDADRNVFRLVKTRAEVLKDIANLTVIEGESK